MLKISITLPNNAQINLESEDSVVIDKILGMVLLDITRDMLVSQPAANGNPSHATREEERAAPVETPSTQPVLPTIPAPTVITEIVTSPVVKPDPSEGDLASAEVEIEQEAAPDVNPNIFPPIGRPSGTPDAPSPAVYGFDPYKELAVERRDEPDGDWPDDEDEEYSEGETLNVTELVGGGLAPASQIVSSLSEQAFIDFCRAANPLGDMRRVVVAAEGASRYLGIEGVDADELGRLFDLAAWPRAHNFVQTLRNAARSKFGWLERVPGRAGYYSVTDLGRATALGR